MGIRSRVLGTGMYVPEHVITNEYLSSIVDTSDEWIVTRTGMKERRQVKPDQAASDLVVPAAQMALDRAGLKPRDLDMIIVGTISADYVFPSAACLVQDRLGAGNIPAFDVSAGCTGGIYAIAAADQFIRSGVARHVLVSGVEVLTKIVNWEDRSTCVLFGDGAGAFILGPTDDPEYGLRGTHLASDGSRALTLHMPGGGSAQPPTEESIAAKMHTIHMRGNEIYRTAVSTMFESTNILLEKAGLAPQDVDLFVFHQANLRILESVGKRLEVPSEKVFIDIQKYGNTSSASTLIAIHEAVTEGKAGPGSWIVQVAFGAGLTWGGVIWHW